MSCNHSDTAIQKAIQSCSEAIQDAQELQDKLSNTVAELTEQLEEIWRTQGEENESQ